MGLKCAIHGRDARAVCHHCGQALCERRINLSRLNAKMLAHLAKTLTWDQVCGYVIDDNWFHAERKKPGAKGRTWEEKKTLWNLPRRLWRRLVHLLKKKTDPVMAYHCEECVKAHHPEYLRTLEVVSAAIPYNPSTRPPEIKLARKDEHAAIPNLTRPAVSGPGKPGQLTGI